MLLFLSWRYVLAFVEWSLISASVAQCYKVTYDGSKRLPGHVRELERVQIRESVASSKLETFLGKTGEVLPTTRPMDDARYSPPSSDATFITEKDLMEVKALGPIGQFSSFLQGMLSRKSDPDKKETEAGGGGIWRTIADSQMVIVIVFGCIAFLIGIYVLTLGSRSDDD
eukprot:TRINITY_DN26114_c0_g1_i1.p1 TRINITY_DN26114_c0_g1~~TRINITY_DN26114_c0_g1_i1.p1  ORF type:complete len:170 (+),score=10.92 TRINITY_DN26114_c0_g1_i1:36-545(+)